MVHLDAGSRSTVNQDRSPSAAFMVTRFSLSVSRGIESEGGQKYVGRWNYRAGIRKAEFKGKKVLAEWKPFGQLIGANRHQDFAYVGNALPNSGQWRDAKIAWCRLPIIRVVHYPQDHFHLWMHAMNWECLLSLRHRVGNMWNKNRVARLVHENTRQMIQRDWISCLCINVELFWMSFVIRCWILRWKLCWITKEDPYPGRPVAAADVHSAWCRGKLHVVYGWPRDDEKTDSPDLMHIYSWIRRECGRLVCPYNNNNRASRSWGERPLLVAGTLVGQELPWRDVSYHRKVYRWARGILSIINAVITLILIGEVYSMLSVSLNMLIICIVVKRPWFKSSFGGVWSGSIYSTWNVAVFRCRCGSI